MNSPQNLNIVDVMKFMMSISVIGIHSYIFGPEQFPLLLNYVVMTAVSFFITTSGYLYYRNKENLNQVSWDKLGWKYFKLYFIWVAIYLPLILYGLKSNGCGATENIGVFVYNLLVTGGNPYSYHLWYLLAVGVACFIMYILAKSRISLFNIWILGLVLILVAYFAMRNQGVFGNMFRTIFETGNNGLTYGLGAFATGMMLTRINTHKFVIATCLFLIGLALFKYDQPFSALCGGTSIFLLCSTINLKEHAIYCHLRALSSWVYFIHMYFVFIIMNCIIRGWLPNNRYEGWLIATACSVMASVVIYILSQDKIKSFTHLIR